jgi:hypothetical protein
MYLQIKNTLKTIIITTVLNEFKVSSYNPY